jgi:hypothetical protein
LLVIRSREKALVPGPFSFCVGALVGKCLQKAMPGKTLIAAASSSQPCPAEAACMNILVQ